MNRRWFVALVLVNVCAAHAGDDWPRYARDGALTSRSSLKGRIATPQVAWKFATAAQEVTVELLPVEGRHEISLSGRPGGVPASRPSMSAVALPGPVQADLDGSGTLRPVVETFHERWAKILPDVKGMQRVAWSNTWTDQKVCRLQLFAYDQGFDKPQLLWQTDPPEDTIFSPLNIVCDIDADGVQEICVAAHYRVMIFEGTTGRKETELRFHGSRPYGWFGLFDIDTDGRKEFITIGDFQSHIDVLTYDPAKPEKDRLAVKWRRDIEPNIEERRKWPQVGPRPVVDVTGDGRPEIALSMHNETGDGQWHVVVLDASTGQAVHDWPGRFVQGSADVDGESGEELFLMATNGPMVPLYGRVELMKAGSTPRVLFSREHAAWAAENLPRFGANWSTTATDGMRHVLVAEGSAGRPAAFMMLEREKDTRSSGQEDGRRDARPPGLTFSLMHIADGAAVEEWRASGAILNQPYSFGLVRSNPQGEVGARFCVVVPQETATSLIGEGARPLVADNRPVAAPLATPAVARLTAGGGMSVITEGGGQQIVAIDPPAPGGDRPKVRWRRPGRGMSDGSRILGLLAADLDGDGGCEIAAADQGSAGEAVLTACRGDGSVLWRLPFEQTLGAPPVWNVPALTFWWPGHFRDRDRVDLFVNTRRGLMHSDVGQLVDGRTGEVVWRQEKAIVPNEFSWGYAGIPPGIADVNGDGLDELVSLYPVCFWIADGRTGKLTAGKELFSQKVLPAWAAYGESMVRDFTGDGRPDVLLDSPYILALLDTAGQPIWHGLGRMAFPTTQGAGNAGQTTPIRHALCDIDGDGAFEIASGGYAEGVRVIDPREGKVLWSLAAPAPTCPRVVAADIDGQKGDEILYPAGDTLVAITGDRSGGRVLWTWKGPANLSMPAIADTDGDGLAEIVVQSADGVVHCLDSGGSEFS